MSSRKEREDHGKTAFGYMGKEEAENYNLQLRKMIHVLAQKREHAECHEQLAREELVVHQHNQQMAHKESEGGKQEETEEPGKVGNRIGTAVRSEKNIWRMRKQLVM